MRGFLVLIVVKGVTTKVDAAKLGEIGKRTLIL